MRENGRVPSFLVSRSLSELSTKKIDQKISTPKYPSWMYATPLRKVQIKDDSFLKTESSIKTEEWVKSSQGTILSLEKDLSSSSSQIINTVQDGVFVAASL